MSQTVVEEAPPPTQRVLVILDANRRNEQLQQQHDRIVAQITAQASWFGPGAAWALGSWLLSWLLYFGWIFSLPVTALTAWIVSGTNSPTTNSQSAGNLENPSLDNSPAIQPNCNPGGSGPGPDDPDDPGDPERPSGNSNSFIGRNANLPNRPVNVVMVNAAFIDRDRSSRTSVLLMDQAGELFIQQGKTPPLIRREHHYTGRITSGADVENLVNSICGTLRTIIAVSARGLPSLAVATDDIKLVLVDLFQRILTTQNARTNTQMEWSCPFRQLHGDGVGWVKYMIQADSSHESYCLSTKQEVDFHFKVYAYAFPSMADLEESYKDALRRSRDG